MTRFVIVLFVSATILLLYRYSRSYDDSITYQVTTTAESTELSAYPFEKGPFQFSFKGHMYALAEVFSAGPIIRNIHIETGFIALILVGVALLLTIATALPRTLFIGFMALFMVFIISMKLPETGLFGLDNESVTSVVILLAALVIPAYLLHAFFPEVNSLFRFIGFCLIIGLIVFFAQVPAQALIDQFTAHSYFGLVIVALIFLFLIAEENVFAILYLITKTKGGKHNHLHFIVFSLVYLVILGLYYGKKSGNINTEIAFFDPFVLLTASGLVALWSYQHKQDLYRNLLDQEEMRCLLAALGIITLGFLSLAMYRGNDAVYEGLHYVIIYTHLAFGGFFFIYILINLITPLIQGIQTFKIAYKTQNFPYASARLAGIVTVAAFFFLANKEPFLLFRAGQFNYLGAQAEAQGDQLLADGYYRQGTIFGHDNHFSNYKLAYKELQKGDFNEANFRFGRAALRYPSPQAYLNKSSSSALMSEATPSMIALKEGLREFPANAQLQNNLGLTYADQGKTLEATDLLSQSKLSGEWTNANLVNLWKIKQNTESATSDFEKGNLAVKTNVLHHLLQTNQEANLAFDASSLYPSYHLHRLCYLINASWYFNHPQIPQEIEKALSIPVNEDMLWHAKWATALSLYGQGEINQSLRTIDQMIADTPDQKKGQLYTQMGLIALNQHSIDEALGFFEKAIAEGSRASLLNKQACLLEKGAFDQAAAWGRYLVSIDSAYINLQNDLKAIESPSGLSQDLQKMRLYYKYPLYSNAEIAVILTHAAPSFIQSMWAKVAKEMLTKNDRAGYLRYQSIFKNYLDAAYFFESDVVIALLNNQEIPASDHPIRVMMGREDSTTYTQLAHLANRNAFNEPLILGILNYLEPRDPNRAYQVLVEAIDIHKTNTAFRQKYVHVAIRSGLTSYAEEMMQELQSLLLPDAYQQFDEETNQLKAKIAASSW